MRENGLFGKQSKHKYHSDKGDDGESKENLLLDKIVELYGVIPPSEEDENNMLAINFINYVNDNYNKNITLESTAKHFGYSKEYFSKKFKQVVDKNFLTFVNSIRVQRAMEMLDNPNNKLSFLDICLACGFNNSTSLYRHLKKADYTHPSTIKED